MLTTIPLLQNVKVASPCSASWEGMEQIDGDRVHFCSGCKKNVYNLSALSQVEAEGLLRKHEGHLCVRYYQRKDGTILTQNCPVGLQAVRFQLICRSLTTALLLLVSGMGGTVSPRQRENSAFMGMRVHLPVTSSLPLPPKTLAQQEGMRRALKEMEEAQKNTVALYDLPALDT
jgi:hypothetical protein